VDGQAERLRTTRLFLLAWGGLLWAIVILLRLVHLQVVRHAEYAQQARAQHIRNIELPAPRGAILDRAGRPLALRRRLDSVYVDPRHIPDSRKAAYLLAGPLKLDPEDLYQKLESARRQRRGFLWVQRRISPEQSESLRSLRHNWIRFQPEIVRQYPKGTLAAHLLGAVSFDQQGSSGLEYSLERELRGRNGRLKILADVFDREVTRLDPGWAEQPEPGANIGLSIDERIQFAAERELQIAAEAEGCWAGSVVVMKPDTGELLALASFPGFDPNQPPRNRQEAELRAHNHAVSVPFEPGSVFKVVTITAALETTNLRPETVIPCGNGRITLYGRTVRDHHSYAALPMADVLAHSSNIGAIQVGLKVGEDRMYEYVRRFGFGSRTGVPLPAESKGRLRELAAWQKTSLASIAMGHEISATTLQLARAVAVIANGGLLVKPKLILWRQRPGAAIQPEPDQPPVRVLRAETANLMRRLMEGVVLRGTGRAARLDGYSAGGKTGTAQIYDPVAHKYLHVYNASFVGFAPAVSPAIVVAVTLRGARHYGGAVAAPVFRKVAQEALRLMNVPKDLPESPADDRTPVETNDLAVADLGSPPEEETATVAELGDPPAAQPAPGYASAAVIPDFQGKPLPAVLRQALAAGLQIEPVGSGVARAQFPEPGAPLLPGARVRVVFAP